MLSFIESIHFQHNENWSYLYSFHMVERPRKIQRMNAKSIGYQLYLDDLIALFFFVFFVCVPRTNHMIFFK